MFFQCGFFAQSVLSLVKCINGKKGKENWINPMQLSEIMSAPHEQIVVIPRDKVNINITVKNHYNNCLT